MLERDNSVRVVVGLAAAPGLNPMAVLRCKWAATGRMVATRTMLARETAIWEASSGVPGGLSATKSTRGQAATWRSLTPVTE